MSGGQFDYAQYRIEQIIEGIKDIIENNSKEDDDGYMYDYPDDIINEFEKCIEYLEISKVYAQRIDWLVSGDDGEDSFRKRLKDDLENLKESNEVQ